MQIDWLTVTAQVANFLILIFLLHRFLYGPIIRAMDRRQQSITSRFEEARRLAESAEEEGRGYRDQRRQFDEQQETLLTEARAEADALRARLIEEARRAVESQRTEWYQQLHRERQDFLQGARRLAAEQVVAVARRALVDLAGVDLESRILEIFIERLDAMDAETRRQLADDCREAGNTLQVATRFDLAETLRARLTTALRAAIAPDAEVAYVHDAELACGLRLGAGGHVMAWSLSGYLDGLSESLSDILTGRPVPDETAGNAVTG